MKKDLISIIIPVYNVQDYVEKCIKSVIKQTYENLEIIIVNDGSTDKSGEICKKYEKIDNRIKIIEKENGGVSSARNIGLKIAKGKYIGFVDPDDYIDKDMYELLYDNIKKYNADISICNFYLVRENNIFHRNLNTSDILVFNKKEALQNLIKNREISDHASNKLYKKELFCNIKYPENTVMEDIATTYLLIEKSKKIVYDKKEKYYYVNRKDSILNKR